MSLKSTAFLFLFFSGITEGRTLLDKSVQWGYKLTYAQELKKEAIHKLRKTLKSRGVTVLYPPDNSRVLSAKFFSVSSYLTNEEIQSLSPEIQQVEPAEKTQVIKLQFQEGLDEKEMKRILKLFPHYKIQILAQEEGGNPLRLTVKTSLGKEQLKSSPTLGPFVEVIEN